MLFLVIVKNSGIKAPLLALFLVNKSLWTSRSWLRSIFVYSTEWSFRVGFGSVSCVCIHLWLAALLNTLVYIYTPQHQHSMPSQTHLWATSLFIPLRQFAVLYRKKWILSFFFIYSPFYLLDQNIINIRQFLDCSQITIYKK